MCSESTRLRDLCTILASHLSSDCERLFITASSRMPCKPSEERWFNSVALLQRQWRSIAQPQKNISGRFTAVSSPSSPAGWKRKGWCVSLHLNQTLGDRKQSSSRTEEEHSAMRRGEKRCWRNRSNHADETQMEDGWDECTSFWQWRA